MNCKTCKVYEYCTGPCPVDKRAAELQTKRYLKLRGEKDEANHTT